MARYPPSITDKQTETQWKKNTDDQNHAVELTGYFFCPKRYSVPLRSRSMLERCSQITIAAIKQQQIALNTNRRHACAARDEVDEGTDRVQSSDDNTAKRDDMGNRNLD